MEKRYSYLFLYVLIFIVFLIVYKTVVINNYLEYEKVYTSSFLIMYSFMLYKSFGLFKYRSTYKYKKTFFVVIYEIIIYLILLFGLGLIFGYSSNSLSYRLDLFIVNTLFPLINIITIELIRYIFIHSVKENNYIKIIINILLITYELLTSINLFSFNSYEGVFLFLSVSFTPVVIKNILLTLLCEKGSYKLSITYRVLLELLFILLPIQTSLNEYLSCVISILLPLVVYGSVNKIYENTKEKSDTKLIDNMLSSLIIVIVMLLSGIFNTSIISVASDSMNPIIKRGDAVIVHKYKDSREVKKGDIIAFSNKLGINVVHRINTINDEKYITKGDANNTIDDEVLNYSSIRGKVILRLPYIGYPSIWLNEKSMVLNEQD